MSSRSAATSAAKPAAPGVLVILGASGDLTKRLLMPALLNLACDRLLPDGFAVVGMGRDVMTSEEFRERQRGDIRTFCTRGTVDADRWSWLESRLHYMAGEFDDAVARFHADVEALDCVVGQESRPVI
jgi:glucose-6-phosphate 1-dehydrogenase